MPLTKVELINFTAFADLEVGFSPGINVLIGANSTGKTHLLKVCYAACEVSRTGDLFTDKLMRVFLPMRRGLRPLVKRQKIASRGRSKVDNQVALEVSRESGSLQASFSSGLSASFSVDTKGAGDWEKSPIESVYIPVKEMLSNGPGFISLYAAREIHFDEVYVDILHRAYLPLPRGRVSSQRQSLLNSLQKAIEGRVIIRNEEFFLYGKSGPLEFSLLAEGIRKLALLWVLIRNGSLSEGSVLFWDEPETNLNPQLYGVLIDALLGLQRAGVQIFLATHDYVILKELDLRLQAGDQVAYHSLYRAEDDEIAGHTTGNYLGIHPNAIADTFTDLYDREIERSLSGMIR